MSEPLRVLIVEDSKDDALLIARELRRGGYDLQMERVDTPQGFGAALAGQTWDVIIADYSMPRFSGLAALEMLRKSELDLPFVLVSGTIGEEIAVAAMKAGAHDYVLKDNLARLEPAVRRELQEIQVRRARKRAEQLLRALNHAALAMEKALTPDEIFSAVAEEFARLGLSCTILVTDQKQSRLSTRYLSHNSGMLRTVEKLVGLKIEEFFIPIQDVDLYQKIIWERQTILVENTEELTRQILPRSVRRFAPRLVTLLNVPKFIGSPLIVEDQVIGLFSVESTDLTEDDTATVTAFAHQVAAAWHRAQLFEQAQQEIAERILAEQALRESQERYRQAVENSPNPTFSVDREGIIQTWNRACETVFQYTAQEAIGKTYHQLLWDSENSSAIDRSVAQVFRSQALSNQDISYRCRDGTRKITVSRLYPLLDQEDTVEECVFANTDITERRRAERLLRALNEAALAVEQALTPEGIFAAVGREFRKLGFSCAVFFMDDSRTKLQSQFYSYDNKATGAVEKLLGIKATEFSIPIETVEVIRETVCEGKTILAKGNEVVPQLLPPRLKGLADQVVRLLEVPKTISSPLFMENEIIGLLSVQSDDLTEDDIPAITAFANQVSAAWRKARLVQDLEQSLEELKRTQAQFLQAQKMEAIGRLAGGVAHDFNNLLTVIQISTQLLMRQLRPEDPLWEHIQQIQEAGERATSLTRQLLSFSRREIIKPQIVNLSQIVSDLNRMLRRVIGEDIELVTHLAKDLLPVRADPSQIEQIIVNLAVNARDAMPQGGQLAINTENVVLDKAHVTAHIDAQPGEHVLLTMIDTGMGMSEEVKAHLFEPFFTTKKRGEGTGLGLPTVYGIVRQSGGHIWVHSEIGQGTTFKIYLPCADEAEDSREAPSPMQSIRTAQGSETVLVVEDDASVQVLATQILKSHGYQVLAAKNGLEALQVSREYKGPIHLLLTDVVMPEMNGRELATRLRSQRQELRVLYMSGYSDSVIAHHGILDEEMLILAKPFTLETLIQQVQTALDEPSWAE
jgi:two-component system cell cycle sensor histidine kinase/response regulator CckA